MSWIMIHTTSKKVIESLSQMKKLRPKLFVLDMYGGVKIMKNNGFTLAYLANLILKHPNTVDIYVVEPITLHQFPEICKKAGDWLAHRDGRNLRYIPKQFNVTKEELEKCRLNFSLSLKK